MVSKKKNSKSTDQRNMTTFSAQSEIPLIVVMSNMQVGDVVEGEGEGQVKDTSANKASDESKVLYYLPP